jgi:2'-5' RNA ligase
MTTFTQKYTIIQLFEPMDVGAQFSPDNWPLHSTLVDTFAIDWDIAEIIKQLNDVLPSLKVAHTVAGEDTFFGPEKQTCVTLLQKTTSLTKLHYDIITSLDRGGLKLNDPQFARDGFLPHATVQKHARLHKGDEVSFNALTVIDMFPDGDPYKRRVLATISLPT